MIVAKAVFRAVGGLLAPLAPYAAIALAGAVAWHCAPILGPAATMARINAEKADWKAAAEDWQYTAETWQAATARCEGARDAEHDKAAKAVEQASEQRAVAVSSAFDQGWAAGRAVGRRQCGVTNNAQVLAPIPDDGSSPGSLRDGADLSEAFGRGAYRP